MHWKSRHPSLYLNKPITQAWVRVGFLFLMWWPPSTMWTGPLIFGSATRDFLIIPSFWIGFVCCMLSTFRVSSWIVTNIIESSLLLSQYLFKLCWRETLPENDYPYLVLQNVALPGCFPYILCYPMISSYFLLVDLLLQCMALLQSRDLVKW